MQAEKSVFQMGLSSAAYSLNAFLYCFSELSEEDKKDFTTVFFKKLGLYEAEDLHLQTVRMDNIKVHAYSIGPTTLANCYEEKNYEEKLVLLLSTGHRTLCSSKTQPGIRQHFSDNTHNLFLNAREQEKYANAGKVTKIKIRTEKTAERSLLDVFKKKTEAQQIEKAMRDFLKGDQFTTAIQKEEMPDFSALFDVTIPLVKRHKAQAALQV